MQTLSLTNLSLGSSSVGLSVFVSVAGLTGGFAADGDVLTASVNNPADGVTYTFRYDFSGGGSSSGASYTVDFAGDSLSDGDTITVVMLADAVEVASRDLTVYQQLEIVAAGGLADLTLDQNTAMTAVDVSADFTGYVESIALQSGTLPAGLSFNGTTLSGTPSALQEAATLTFRASNPTDTADTAFQVSVIVPDLIDPVINTFTIGAPTGTSYPMTLDITEADSLPVTAYFGAYLTSGTALTDQEVIDGTGLGFGSVSTSVDLVDSPIDLGALAAGDYTVKVVVVDGAGNEESATATITVAATGAVFEDNFDTYADGTELSSISGYAYQFKGPARNLTVDATTDAVKPDPAGSGNLNLRCYHNSVLTGDQISEIELGTDLAAGSGGTGLVSVVVCSDGTGSNEYYLTVNSNGTYSVTQRSGGSNTTLSAITSTAGRTAGSVWRLERDSTNGTLKVFLDDVEQTGLAVTGNTTFTSGFAGFGMFQWSDDPTTEITRFKADDL